jgi:hypothetical protein
MHRPVKACDINPTCLAHITFVRIENLHPLTQPHLTVTSRLAPRRQQDGTFAMLETSNTPPPPPRRSTRRVADDADDDDDDSATEPDAKASDDVVQVSPRKASSPPAFGRSLRSRRASGLERSMLVDNNNNNNNNNSDVVTVIDSSPVPAKRVSSRKRRPAREEDSFVVSDDEDVSLHVNVGSDDDSDAGTRSDSDNGRKKRGRPKKAHADKLPADKLQPNITSFFSKSAAPPPSTAVKEEGEARQGCEARASRRARPRTPRSAIWRARSPSRPPPPA